MGAGPPEGTGLHRYVYLVFKQPGKISDPEHGHLTNRSADKRGGWSVAKFAQKHNLTPVAGNFFLVSLHISFFYYIMDFRVNTMIMFLNFTNN